MNSPAKGTRRNAETLLGETQPRTSNGWKDDNRPNPWAKVPRT